MTGDALFCRRMRFPLLLLLLSFGALSAHAQIQIDLKFQRLQYIAYEPVTATLGITNLAGRDIDLHDSQGQAWFGLEVTGSEGQPIGPLDLRTAQPPLKIGAGQHVTQKVNIANLYPVHDFGTYHVRAHIFFPDLGKFFYSPARVFEVTDARPIWQQTVGVPDASIGSGQTRTYSLMTNRFPDHTSLYVRVADKDREVVFATYSLGRAIAFDDPQVQIDVDNRLHVLHCSGPRAWAYSCVGLNGELLAHSSYMEAKTRPRLIRSQDGNVSIKGGIENVKAPTGPNAESTSPKLSDRPPKPEAKP